MAILFTVAPFNVATLSRPLLGFADGDDRRLAAPPGAPLRFWPGMSRSPTLNREGWNGDFYQGVFLPQAAVNVNMHALKREHPLAPRYRWNGAPLKIYRGEPGDDWSAFELLFDGLVLNATADEGALRLTAQVDSEPFEGKVLTSEYDGRGGAGGVDDLAERMKPACLGRCQNVEPVPIDVTNNVFQVHGYGSIEAFRGLYERGIRFGPPVGDYPSYATLVAATVPEGQWATCLAEGMFRLGAPPFGLITVDVSGDNVGGFHQSTAAVMRRLAEIAGVDPSRFDNDSLNAFEAAVPYPISVYQTAPEKLIDVLSGLALPCNAHASLSWLGKLQVTRFAEIPAPTLRLDVQGRELPPVLGCTEQAVSAPYHRLEVRYARSWRVHTRDELVLDEDLAILPKTIWRHYPEKPPTPEGNDVPSGWWDFKPEMTRPTVMDDGRILFGPVWESHANQKGGVTTDDGWSEPVLDDARYKGFILEGTKDSDLSLGGADSIRVDGNGFKDCRWIPQPIAGPWRLTWFVRDSDTRAAVGIMFNDPADVASLSWDDIHTGVVIAPHDGSPFGLGNPGIFPFTAGEIDGGYSDDLYNRSHAAVPSFSEYRMLSNGELVELYINRELVRSWVIDRTLLGDACWPVFYLEGWQQSFGFETDIFEIQWVPGTPARILDFPVDAFSGALRRMRDEDGFEINAPFMPPMSGAGLIEAKEFRGAGMMQATVANKGTGTGTSVLELRTSSSDRGRVELDTTGVYRVYVLGDLKNTGVWIDGDEWRIEYRGRYSTIYRNGVLIKKKRVTKNQTVYPRFEFAQSQQIYDLSVQPENEAEYQYKGSVIATDFPAITDASPQNVGGYTIIGTSADLTFAVPDASEDGDELRIAAVFDYYWFSGGSYTAPFYLPEPKVEVSFDAGGSWADVPGTWTPDPADAAYPGGANPEQMTFAPDALLPLTGTGTVRARLVAKNTQTGTYNVTIMGVSYVAAEWLA